MTPTMTSTTATKKLKIVFMISDGADPVKGREVLASYKGPPSTIAECDAIVAMGGDGFLLETLRKHPTKPVFGINLGSLGFLMNEHQDGYEKPRVDLQARIAHAESIKIKPLKMTALNKSGIKKVAYAFNDVTLSSMSSQMSKIRVIVDGNERLEELSGDGIIASTPMGSTAYNLSAGGVILPLSSKLIALKSICAFRPRKWSGAILPGKSVIDFSVHEHEKRPVRAVADNDVMENVVRVRVEQSKSKSSTLLFDQGQADERFVSEMFEY